MSFVTRADAPIPYNTTDADGKRSYHGKGLSCLAQANLSLGGGHSLDDYSRQAITEGYCCGDAKRTNWHGNKPAESHE